MPTTRKDHQALNAQAVEAAEWMRDEMARNKGTLTQEDAWKGVRKLFGETFARGDAQAGLWFTKPVLGAFRKLTPNAMWDPAGKRWLDRKSEAVDGVRMM